MKFIKIGFCCKVKYYKYKWYNTRNQICKVLQFASMFKMFSC